MIKIETIHTAYSELFSITFRHSAYEMPLDQFLSGSITILPDKNTTDLFAANRMSYRFYNNTLLCFSECAVPLTDPRTASVDIDNNIKIRFLIQSRNDFFAKTYITAAGKKKIYQFSNKNNNTNATETFLTAPVDIYNSANDYDQGTVVQDAGKLYGARQTVLAAKNIPLADTSFWDDQLGAFEEVVSNADLQDAATVGASADCFAVIDMFGNVVSARYQFLGAGDELMNPGFIVKFKSKLKF